MDEDAFHTYRRRLPHWRLAGAVYFVTWRLHPSQVELDRGERSLVASALGFFHRDRYDLLAHVVMNDHVHVLVRPRDTHRLEEIVRSWKSYTGHRLAADGGRASPVWQDEYLDRIVRDDAELHETAKYILENPWRRWTDLEGYPWVGVNLEEPE